MKQAIQKENRHLDHIPGHMGLPIIGGTISLLRNPRQYAKKRHAKYGNIVKGRNIYATAAVMHGPDAAQFVLQNKEQAFSSRAGWWKNLGRLFPNALMLQDFAEHRLNRKIMQEAFRKEAIERYFNIIKTVYRHEIANWQREKTIEVYPTVKALLLKTSFKLFFGDDLDKNLIKINRDISKMTAAAAALVRMSLPPLALWRGIQARKRLVLFLEKLVETKRQHPDHSLLSQLANARTEENETFSTQDVVDHMLFVIMASHDTTTSTTTSTLYELSKNPEWINAIKSSLTHTQIDLISLEQLNTLSDLDIVVKETLRLHPPVPVIPRRTITETRFDNISLPTNTMTWIPIFLNHRLENYWSNPDTFDPTRFLRKEDRQHKFQYLPFGSGAHICLGQHVGDMMVKLLIITLLKHGSFHSTQNLSELPFLIFPFPKPKKPFYIHLNASQA